MAVTWLKHKYAVGADYKNMKAKPRTNASKAKNRNTKIKYIALLGDKILLINLSGENHFCAGSGRLLPKHGMAIKYKDQIYASRSAIPK